MRVTTAFNRLLGLPGVWVRDVVFGASAVTVVVALKRQTLACPECGFTTMAAYERHRPHLSQWRHLDLGVWRLEVRARLRRLVCPTHGVRVEAVPFARHRSGFTRDFEDLVAWLATRMDKTALSRLVRIDWASVGRICQRVVDDELEPGRLDELFEIGVDEVSWRRHHRYLTLVTDHRRGKVIWGAPGRDAGTLDEFFAALGEDRAGQLKAISMDMGKAFRKSARDHASQAQICVDPFHVVQLVTDALDKVRRTVWRAQQQIDPQLATVFKGARWALLKNPENLSPEQAEKLTAIRDAGGELATGYQLKETLRALFHGDLRPPIVAALLDGWCQMATRSGLLPFAEAAATLTEHRDGILNALRLGINNGRAEGLNNRVRLITRRAYGFHSAEAALALVMLSCGPITLQPPHEKPAA